MITVVKLGGELALPERTTELEAILRSLVTLFEGGDRLVVTHGGGPQVSALMRARGIEPRLVEGRRVTDDAALEALLMAVGGEVNVRLTSAILGVGLTAVGLNGLAGRCITCVRQPPRSVRSAGGARVDYGAVGDVTHVDRDFLGLFLERGMVPVVACIGADAVGRPLNVNGDALASAVASSLEADRLLLFTGAPGVLRDPARAESRWSTLDVEEAQAAIERGAIAGGMIAKLEEAFLALEAGVREVFVLGRVGPGDVEAALAAPGTVGTVLRRRA